MENQLPKELPRPEMGDVGEQLHRVVRIAARHRWQQMMKRKLELEAADEYRLAVVYSFPVKPAVSEN